MSSTDPFSSGGTSSQQSGTNNNPLSNLVTTTTTPNGQGGYTVQYDLTNVHNLYASAMYLSGITGPTGLTALTYNTSSGAVTYNVIAGPTGPTGPTGQGGGTGGGGGTDPNLLKNIALFSYVYGATGTYSYNRINKQLTYNINIFGNSSNYNLTYTFSPPISTFTYDVSNSGLINNSSSAGFNTNYTLQLTNPTPRGYTGIIAIDTYQAGGTGTGSLYTLYLPVTITQSDPIGNPTISTGNLSLTNPSQKTVSGINYYGPSTSLQISQYALTLSNIYNIIAPSSTTNTCLDFTGACTEVTYPFANLVYSSSHSTPFSTALGSTGQNINFTNGTPITLTVTSASSINLVVTNSVGGTTSLTPLFPSTTTGQSAGVTTIGYLPGNVDETTIPLNQGGTTITGITSQMRYSISGPTGTVQSFNSSSMGTYDPMYYPYDGFFYATSSAITALGSYLLPSSPSFTSGTKYLAIQCTTSLRVSQFNLNVGSSATNVSNVFVIWNDGTSNYGWYDASVLYTNTGGCLYSARVGNTFPIAINTSASPGSGPGYFIVNIAFTGKIKLNEIIITA